MIRGGRWLALLCLLASGIEAQEQRSAANDPGAVMIPMRAGASLESVLAALNARGYRIVYSTALVQPSMTLRETPTSTRIDELLREILAPWNLRAVHAANGDWLIVGERVPMTGADDIVDDQFESI